MQPGELIDDGIGSGIGWDASFFLPYKTYHKMFETQ